MLVGLNKIFMDRQVYDDSKDLPEPGESGHTVYYMERTDDTRENLECYLQLIPCLPSYLKRQRKIQEVHMEQILICC